MRRDAWQLINFERFEAIPAALARPRGSATARILARSEWLLRRKSDGRFLAAVGPARALVPLDPAGRRLLRTLRQLLPALRGRRPADTLPLVSMHAALAELAVPPDYGTQRGLALVAEPRGLAFAGVDRYRRPLWLTPGAARGWRRLQAAARADGVHLDAISGYRSHAYQLGIFRRKLARGQTVAEILAVNAAPGYSEHHGGDALDIGTRGEPPAEESFERTAAFAWLARRAGEFGFTMSYPRDNPHGIVYEPWHWRHRDTAAPRRAFSVAAATPPPAPASPA
ncbi:D-alanyl-D-alanine carboxypeptidase family protein [Coralloluteibacterium stylophorae]|uniref:D-alanyl-D-alanine carboxypeptidase family protein n=1 Tax=Coralloluteibacterium stylophorae TaxID=1776034 RepID=A0A8J8AWG4_9GAMM|nr:D-alanyl-D-alanine carboxypeptidase family protein [Coralloluteibacterium stylophorae]